MAGNKKAEIAQLDLTQAVTFEKDYPSSDDFTLELGRWITAKGMLIPSRKEVPEGTMVHFAYTLQGKRDILRGQGKVLWFKEGAGKRPSGFGMGFLELSERSRKNIKLILAWKAANDL